MFFVMRILALLAAAVGVARAVLLWPEKVTTTYIFGVADVVSMTLTSAAIESSTVVHPPLLL